MNNCIVQGIFSKYPTVTVVVTHKSAVSWLSRLLIHDTFYLQRLEFEQQRAALLKQQYLFDSSLIKEAQRESSTFSEYVAAVKGWSGVRLHGFGKKLLTQKMWACLLISQVWGPLPYQAVFPSLHPPPSRERLLEEFKPPTLLSSTRPSISAGVAGPTGITTHEDRNKELITSIHYV